MDGLSSKLKELEQNLVELASFRELDRSSVLQDRKLRWALRYGLLESIQRIIDVACALVSDRKLGYPKTYADCIRLLGEADILDAELTQALVRTVGMRNILVHEYLEVDDEELYAALDRLDDLRAFARSVVPYLT